MNKRIKKKKRKQEAQNFKNNLGTILAMGTGLSIPLEYLKADEYIKAREVRLEKVRQQYIDNVSKIYKDILNDKLDEIDVYNILNDILINKRLNQTFKTMEEFTNE